MLLNSIRWKIQVWHGLLLVVLVGGLLTVVYGLERSNRLSEADARLHALLTPLLPRLAPPDFGPPPGGGDRGPGPRNGKRPPPPFEGAGNGGPPFPPPPEDDRPGPALPGLQSGEFYFVHWSPEGQLLQQSVGAPANSVFPGRGETVGLAQNRTQNGFREVLHYGPGGDCVVVGTSLAPLEQQFGRLAWKLAGAGLAVVAIGLAGGWWVAGRAIRPIAEISAAAGEIAGGDLTKRISLADAQSELGQLAQVLNHTFDRLEATFEQQVRFTADASHELRTPIAVILTQIQLALSRERSGEEYRQTLETCERAAERMRTLVNQLLALARIDSDEFRLNREPGDLARIVREAIELVTPLAVQKKVTLHQAVEPVTANVDALKLSQVLVNLLSNAMQHNRDGIEVNVRLTRAGNRAVLSVKDNGAGIPASAQPHLFDRFYRMEKSRVYSKGNTGLGLAITKAIVEAHGGTIEVRSAPGQGAEFLVDLPLAPETTEAAKG